MDDANRREFLRRTGALGIAGAAALGFPLLETRVAGAMPLLPPRDTIAAGGGATIKIGHIDGFSGVYAAASESQQTGLQAAIDIANRKNSRVQFEIVRGDDANQPAVDARRVDTSPRQKAHPWRCHLGHRDRPAEQPGRHLADCHLRQRAH